MLGEIDMEKYLDTGLIEHVTCGGESGSKARPCDFRWIQDVRRQCIRHGVSFYFKQTGAVFVKDGRTEEKEVYSWSTYIHCDGSFSTCHDLGSNISGTEYDVAHVKWGGEWQMQSHIGCRSVVI